MSEIFCNSCLRSSISADGVACFYCGSYETRRVFSSNIHPPMPKPYNACTEYYTPAADALTENAVEGSTLLDQASIPTKGNEFNSYFPVGQRHAQEISGNKYCLPVGKTCNAFDQTSITNSNLMPVLPSERKYQPSTNLPVSEIVDSPNDNSCTEYYNPAVVTLSENVEEGSMLLEQSSIPTKGNEFKSYVPVGQRHAQEISVNNYCLPVGKKFNSFNQAFITNWNVMPVLPSESKYQHSTNLPVSEIADLPNDNAGTEYYTPASDALTENAMEGSMLLDQASIPRKEIEFGSDVQFSQRHAQEISMKNYYLPVDKIGNAYDMDSITDWNLLPVLPNQSKKQPTTKKPVNEIVDLPNNNQRIMHPDTEASKIRNSLPANDLCPVPGPSSYALMAFNDISDDEFDEEKVYKCISCTYQTSLQKKLQRHSYEHQDKKTCTICDKIYVGDSHNDERKCVVCPEMFKCRTQLNEHLLDHEDYFLTYCWGCINLIKMHSTKEDEKTRFECCVCGYKTGDKWYFTKHNNVHRPKRFCRICGEEYDQEDKFLHFHVNKCFGCDREFECKVQLEDHLLDESKCWYKCCFLCKAEIVEHLLTPKSKTLFKCCKCRDKVVKTKYNFSLHLFTHSKLRPFKCNRCKKRFPVKSNLKSHSEKCSKLLFKCEICDVPFPRIDSVDVHRLEKHC